MADVENVNIQQLLQVSTNRQNQLINGKDDPKAIVNKSIFNQVIGTSNNNLNAKANEYPGKEMNADNSDEESVVSSSGNMPAFFLNDPMQIDESREHILQQQFMKKGFGTTFRKPRKSHDKSEKAQYQQSNEMTSTKNSCESSSHLQNNQLKSPSLKEQFVQKKKKSITSTEDSVNSSSHHQQVAHEEIKKDDTSEVNYNMNTWASKRRNLSSNNKAHTNQSNECSQPDSTVFSPPPTSNPESQNGMVISQKNAAQLRMTLEEQRRKYKANLQKRTLSQEKKAVERNQMAFRKAVMKKSDKSEIQFPSKSEIDSDAANDADVDDEQNSESKTPEAFMKTSQDEVDASLLDPSESISTPSPQSAEFSTKSNTPEAVTEIGDDHVTTTRSNSIQTTPTHGDPGKPPIMKATSPTTRSGVRIVKYQPHTRRQDQGEQTSPQNEFMNPEDREFEDNLSEISSVSRYDRRHHMLRRSTSQRNSRFMEPLTDQEDSSLHEPYSQMSHPNIYKRNSMTPARPNRHSKSYYSNQYMTDVEDIERDPYQRSIDFSSDTEGRMPPNHQARHQRPPFYPQYPPPQHQKLPYGLPQKIPHYFEPPAEFDMQNPFYQMYYPPYGPPPTQAAGGPIYRNTYYGPTRAMSTIRGADPYQPNNQAFRSSLDLSNTNNQLEELQKKLHEFQEEVKLMTSQQRLVNSEQACPMPPLDARDFMNSSNSTLNDLSSSQYHHKPRRQWGPPKEEIALKFDQQKSRFRNEEPFVKRSMSSYNPEAPVLRSVKLPTFTSQFEEIKSQPLDLHGPRGTASQSISNKNPHHHMTYPILGEEKIDPGQEDHTDPEEIMSLPINNNYYFHDDDDSLSITDQQLLVAKPESLVIEYNKPDQDRLKKKLERMKKRQEQNKELQRKIQEEGRIRTEERLKEEALKSEKKQKEAERKREILEAYKSQKDAENNDSSLKEEVNLRGSTMAINKQKLGVKSRPNIQMPNNSRNEPTQSSLNRNLSPQSGMSRLQNSRKSVDRSKLKVVQKPARNQSTRDTGSNVPGWASKHASDVDLSSFNPSASVKRKQSRTNSVHNLTVSHQGSFSVLNNPANLSSSQNLKLYVRPKVKSNRSVITNAIQFCCLAGGVNQAIREATLLKMKEADGQHFMILFRDSRCQYRGLYCFDGETEDCNLVVGTGPAKIHHEMVELFYKYNSGGKKFTPITTTKHLSTVVDAISIQNSYWQVRASLSTNSPSK